MRPTRLQMPKPYFGANVTKISIIVHFSSYHSTHRVEIRLTFAIFRSNTMATKQLSTPTRMSSTTSTLHKNPRSTSKRGTTFRSAVNHRLDHPFVSLFCLGISVLEFTFAIASGISYAIELSHGHAGSAVIYSQVVFALTIITLIIEAVTWRSYRLTFVVRSTICVLWLALFGFFFNIYYCANEADEEYASMDTNRMKRAVWVDMVNFLLWFASAVFSMVVCCSGIKGATRGKLERRRLGKDRSNWGIAEAEEGVIGSTSRHEKAESLPLYEEIAAIARAT